VADDGLADDAIVEMKRATSPADLQVISDWLHDCWLSLPDSTAAVGVVSLDGMSDERAQRHVVRSVGPFVRYSPLHRRLTLSVAGVKSVALVDDAMIDETSVSRLVWDEDASTLVIEGNIPVTLTFIVDALDVTLVVHRDLVTRRERWGLARKWSSHRAADA